MTTYMPTCVTRSHYLPGQRHQTTRTDSHVGIETDDPTTHYTTHYTVTFSSTGVTVAKHMPTGPVLFLRHGDPLRADLVALAERTVRAHFDGEVL